MDYRRLISESWKYTQSNKKLILWFGFFPALFTTTVGAGYIAYQFFAFKSSYLFSEDDKSFLHDVMSFIWEFVQQHISWTVPLIVLAVIFGIFYLLFPTLAKASAIQMIARNKNGQKAGVGTGFKFGMMSFLQLFEYHLIIKTFAFFAILIEMSFVLRNLGPIIFKFLLPIFLIFIIVSFILTLLFTFTDFYIVIDDLPVFKSMKESAKLVVMNWKHTFLITILMILIGIRIVIQVIMVFLIPLLIVLITGYIATVTLPITGIIVGSIVGVIALAVSAYLNGVVDIFSYTVWTFAFLEITSKKETSARGTVMDDYHAHKNLEA